MALSSAALQEIRVGMTKGKAVVSIRVPEQQVPPLRYAPVGMTLLFGTDVSMCAPAGMTVLLAELASRPDITGGRR